MLSISWFKLSDCVSCMRINSDNRSSDYVRPTFFQDTLFSHILSVHEAPPLTYKEHTVDSYPDHAWLNILCNFHSLQTADSQGMSDVKHLFSCGAVVASMR
jgi:hypothetical protein